MTPKQLMQKATRFVSAGQELPIDLHLALMSAGIDSAALEARGIADHKDSGECDPENGICSNTCTNCPFAEQ